MTIDYPGELAAFIPEFEDEILALYAELVMGRITLAEWHRRMIDLLAEKYIAAWLLGGAPLTPEMIPDLSINFNKQLFYLGRFRDFLSQQDDYAPYLSRAISYAASSVEPFWESTTWGLPLPTYPGVGDTQCLQWCKCEWRIEWINREQGDADAYWTLNPSEHCQTCLERRAQWYPLRIRKGQLQS